LLESELTEAALQELVATMAEEGTLTSSLLVTALCRGRLAFFTAALAALARVPLGNARKLLEGRGGEGVAGRYKKSGLPDSMQGAVQLVLQAVQDLGEEVMPGSLFYANMLVERVLETAGERNIDNLPYFIAIIRQSVRR